MKTETNNVTVMEKRRAAKVAKGRMSVGDKVISITDGNTYLFINGRSGKSATVVTEAIAKEAVKRKQDDEKKNPMLAGTWNQYVLKTEKLTFNTDDLIPQEAYKAATNTDANKGLLKKLHSAEEKRSKLQEDVANIESTIKALNSDLIATMRATV